MMMLLSSFSFWLSGLFYTLFAVPMLSDVDRIASLQWLQAWDIPPNSISNLDRSQAGGNFPLRKVLVKSAFLRKFEKEEWNFLDSKPLGSREFFDVGSGGPGTLRKRKGYHRFIGYSSEIPWKFNSSPLKIYNPKKESVSLSATNFQRLS